MAEVFVAAAAAAADSVAEVMDTVAVVKEAVTAEVGAVTAEVGAATAAVGTGVTVAPATVSPATRRAALPMINGEIEFDSMPLSPLWIGLRSYLIHDLVILPIIRFWIIPSLNLLIS